MAGNNKELKIQLDKIYEGNENVDIMQFTKKAGLYMDAADLMLTKPGGLSTTEAAAKNIPLILTHEIPGCESRNIVFFEEHGMAFYSSKPEIQADFAWELKNDSQLGKDMMDAQRNTINPDASSNICEFIIKKFIQEC